MLRPAQLLALLDWFDLELSSGRRGRLLPSLPGASHLDPESGITTQPSWGRPVAGLAPAGALPLQAARSVATFLWKAIPLCCSPDREVEERWYDRLQGEPV